MCVSARKWREEKVYRETIYCNSTRCPSLVQSQEIRFRDEKSYDQCKIKRKKISEEYICKYIHIFTHARARCVLRRELTRLNRSILALLLCERILPCAITFLCYIANGCVPRIVRLSKWIDPRDVRYRGTRLDADVITSRKKRRRRCRLHVGGASCETRR